MRTVSNATPIISLSSIGKIWILEAIFQRIIIPQAVHDEIKAREGYGYSEVDSDFITVEEIKSIEKRNELLDRLDIGEAETIILSKEVKADNTIIDECIGYAVAKESGLNVIRTLSILLKAKDENIISEIKPLLDEMVSRGRWYSKRVYYSFLRKAGEI